MIRQLLISIDIFRSFLHISIYYVIVYISSNENVLFFLFYLHPIYVRLIIFINM